MPGNVEQREAMLEAILRTAVDAIVTIDERGIIETANPATEKLFGYSLDEMIGQNVKMLMPSPYQQEHDGYLSNYIRTGKAKIIGIGREVIGQRKDGTTFPMELAVSEGIVGEKRFFTGIVRDISDRKQAEQQQASVGRIIEDSLNEIYIFDAETLRFVQVNRGARENTGYSMEELREFTPLDIKPDYSSEQFAELLEPLRSGEKSNVVFYTRHERKDGSFYDVEIHLQMNRFLRKPCFVAIILDITERIRTERELEKLNLELESRIEQRTKQLEAAQQALVRQEKMATLGQVSGGIAHEIKNPLNAIKTSAYYLLNAKSASPDKVREHLERIDRQVNLADNVISALSKFAKLPEPELHAVDIEPCLNESVSSISLSDNIGVEVQVRAGVSRMLVDEGQIMIVFRNLIRNARDAMPEGGKLILSAESNGDEVSVSVKDTGVGIAAEILDQILEPLYTTKARGMGLGLAISRAIVEKHGGELRVTSEQGKGSKFVVSLKSAENGRVES